MTPLWGPDLAPLFALACFGSQESADSGAHSAVVRLSGEGLQMFARCIRGMRAKNILRVVEHGRAEQRCERWGRRRLLSSREEGAEIRKKRGKLVLDVFCVQSGRMKEALGDNVTSLQETESKTIVKNRDSRLCGVATVI